MDEVNFPALSVGQSVIVDLGYALREGEVVDVVESASNSQLGAVFVVKTPGSVTQRVARLEVYALPKEMPRLERDMDCRIGTLSWQVSKLKVGESL